LGWGKSDEMGLKERRWKIVDGINMARDRQKWRTVVNRVTNCGIIKCGELVDWLSRNSVERRAVWSWLAVG
jgi:hypothetical protein